MHATPSEDPVSSYARQIQLAWQGQLSLMDMMSYAESLGEGPGRTELAAVIYRTWLGRNESPANHLAWFNLGTMLSGLGDLEGARQAYLQAVGREPGFMQAHYNLGNVHERLGQSRLAEAEWSMIARQATDPQDRAIRLMACNSLGLLFENERRYDAALQALNDSLRIEPNQPDVLHHWIMLRAKQCMWPVLTPVEGVSPELMRQSTSALAMLALSDDPAEQLAAARFYVETKLAHTAGLPALAEQRNYGHRKIRIGYLSSDLCLHPVAMLTAELFELHDREHFEIYGYCWSREDGSGLRQRIINAMDHFERIGTLSDEAAAQMIREHEIDILVDLHGQTAGARPGILARRPAPIQITYLGLPATTGFPFIDYAIVDRYLVPEEQLPHYSEKPLYMPEIYQVSDRKREVAPSAARQDCGLPSDAFVFCSLNNNYKYTPELFDLWMRLLRRVPGSVLWLLADNPWAQANLRQHAAAHGIDGARLIFAERTMPAVYLARYAVADLFLDTFPFNAGTTANDALWMGLPVLTISGRSFASRMAGALLTAAGLPELITNSFEEYEEKAVALANAPQELARLREHLRRTRESGVLFDTPRFTRHLEQEFTRLVQELPPAQPGQAHPAKLPSAQDA